ncbi:MAG: redoxin domain-containing protein [Solirubrobacteraceae bacterium]
MSDLAAPPGVRPARPAPELEVPRLAGGTFRLADAEPERFTMIVFFRGLHCPGCQAQLTELDGRLDEIRAKGLEPIAVSGETQERTERLRDEWSVESLPLAYGLTEEQMRTWGLFVSSGISEDEPTLFNEPALFLVRPDGTVYYEAILSMPLGRPKLDELFQGVDFWTEHDYPARGVA